MIPKTTAAGRHFGTSSLLISRGPVTIYHLMGGGGGGRRILGGITGFLGEQKGRSLKTSEEFRGGTTQICLVGTTQILLHFSEVTLKGKSANFTLFSLV